MTDDDITIGLKLSYDYELLIEIITTKKPKLKCKSCGYEQTITIPQGKYIYKIAENSYRILVLCNKCNRMFTETINYKK